MTATAPQTPGDQPPVPSTPQKPEAHGPCLLHICIASPEFIGPAQHGGTGMAYTAVAQALADATAIAILQQRILHDAKLLAILDQWVSEIHLDLFEQLVPLLRRTFSTFPRPERRQIGQMLTAGGSSDRSGPRSGSELHHDRAASALPLLLKILGGKS